MFVILAQGERARKVGMFEGVYVCLVYVYIVYV